MEPSPGLFFMTNAFFYYDWSQMMEQITSGSRGIAWDTVLRNIQDLISKIILQKEASGGRCKN
ncbi:hypothetical protein [uncultured Draconibacterium sp.]|uniref:hypothetical protein n=1 Tax=uncultured Draconibacterium sp. TaxID=1573823 RepID=UPI0025CC2EC7|nr:hypothetical protein [uncultured Draconibacterium sp.]